MRTAKRLIAYVVVVVVSVQARLEFGPTSRVAVVSVECGVPGVWLYPRIRLGVQPPDTPHLYHSYPRVGLSSGWAALSIGNAPLNV